MVSSRDPFFKRRLHVRSSTSERHVYGVGTYNSLCEFFEPKSMQGAVHSVPAIPAFSLRSSNDPSTLASGRTDEPFQSLRVTT